MEAAAGSASCNSMKFLAACYTQSGKIEGRILRHGQQIPARNGLVAVVEGQLHPAGECPWCDRVRQLCWSQRSF